MLLLFFNTNQHRPAAFVCGWTCICAYMCAEWEQGHSWGLGFLWEHHLQAFLHLIVKPPLYSIEVSGSSSLPARFPPLAIAYCMLFIWDEEGNNRNWQDYLLTSTSLLRPPHLYRWKKRAESSFRRPPALNAHAHAGKTCALLVSDRRIKKNNDPASWHFELWISFILVNKHQPLCQAVKLL